eukprot:1458646-Rhodomonas_salina.1
MELGIDEVRCCAHVCCSVLSYAAECCVRFCASVWRCALLCSRMVGVRSVRCCVGVWLLCAVFGTALAYGSMRGANPN